MEIRKRFSDNVAILYVSGKIDINSALFIEEIGRLIRDGVDKILCDFSNVDVVDYNGLSIIVIAYKNAANQKAALKFCEVPSHISGIFRAARLDSVFELYENEEAALKSFEMTSKVDGLRLRRRFKRLDLSIPVRFKVGLSTDTALHKGKILNVSAAGVFILSRKTYPVSTDLYLETGLTAAKKPLVVTGSVIWLADKELQPHSYPGMGVSFEGIDSKTENEIIEFIDKNITHRSARET